MRDRTSVKARRVMTTSNAVMTKSDVRDTEQSLA